MPEPAKAVETAKKSSAPAPLKLLPSADFFYRISQLYDSVARRAFEIFEHNGKAFGHELEHWFQAESELLHPIHIEVAEQDGGVTISAEVPGFTAKELDISIEPRRLTISGKRETSEERKNKKTIYTDRCSSQILRVIDLPVEIDTEKATATLKNGVLELKAPKAAPAKKIQIAPAA